jgi:hypothetical protein
MSEAKTEKKERTIPHRNVRIARVAYEAARAFLAEENGKDTLKPFDEASPQMSETIVHQVAAALSKPNFTPPQVWELMRQNRNGEGTPFHELDTVAKVRFCLIVECTRQLQSHYV